MQTLSDELHDIRRILPPHIEQTAQAIARLHAAHQTRATPLQLVVDRLTAIVAGRRSSAPSSWRW